MGRVHNSITTVLALHKRRELFMPLQRHLAEDGPILTSGTLSLVKDGGIRWHSTYMIVKHCLELKMPISRFQPQLRTAAGMDELEEEGWDGEGDDEDDEAGQPATAANLPLPYDPLTDTIPEEDWEEIERLTNFLVSLYEVTRLLMGKMSESGFASLWQTITNVQHLDETAIEPEDSF